MQRLNGVRHHLFPNTEIKNKRDQTPLPPEWRAEGHLKTVKNNAVVIRIVRYLPWLLLPWSAAVWYWYLAVWNPLPSDEEMIENFKANRAEFLEVVHRYRTYPRAPGKSSAFWERDGDTLELFRRAGIDALDAQECWLPNPYSVDTAIRIHGAFTSGSSEQPEMKYKCGALRIRPATTPRIDHPDYGDTTRHYRQTILFGVIWKDYYFIPEIPRIEDGKLLDPLRVVGKRFPRAQFHEKERVATHQTWSKVLPSLNYLPRDWKDFECVYRQIEPQWFLRMCNSH